MPWKGGTKVVKSSKKEPMHHNRVLARRECFRSLHPSIVWRGWGSQWGAAKNALDFLIANPKILRGYLNEMVRGYNLDESTDLQTYRMKDITPNLSGQWVFDEMLMLLPLLMRADHAIYKEYFSIFLSDDYVENLPRHLNDEEQLVARAAKYRLENGF